MLFSSNGMHNLTSCPPAAREKNVKSVVPVVRLDSIPGIPDVRSMQSKLLQINLFGACTLRSCEDGAFEVSGAKHKAMFALLATAPFGRRTRSFLQEKLWGVACYDTGRQSLRRALADIKAVLGSAFSDLIASTNAEVTRDLSRVQFLGLPGQGTFLEWLDIRENRFQQWLAGIRANPSRPVPRNRATS